MKTLLFILISATSALSQAVDTTYFQEIGGRLFVVKETVNADGSASMNRTPVKDTSVISGYWFKKIEYAGMQHARSAAQALQAGDLLAQAFTIKPLGMSLVDSISAAVANRLQGHWVLNGKHAIINGGELVVKKNGATALTGEVEALYTIRALCLQWIVLEDNIKNPDKPVLTHLYLTGDNVYQGFGGEMLVRKKK